jgi:polyferredoxin
MKVKTPPAYIFWLILILVIAILIGVPFTLIAFNILDFQDIFLYIISGIVGWSVIIVLALIGAIFVGMMLSHRILTVGTFTPFEEEMLKMREDIKAIKEKLGKMDKNEPIDSKGNETEGEN